MRRLGAAALALALAPAALSGCGSSGATALGQRPTAYPAAGEGSPAAAEVQPAHARHDALMAATQAAEAILSYDHRSLDADLARASAFMTPTYRAQFRTLAGELRRRTEVTQLATSATVLRAGLQGLTDDQAKVLLFVEQLTSTEGGLGTTARTAVVLTLQRDEGAWLVTALDTESAGQPVAEPSRDRRSALRAARRLTTAYTTLAWQQPRRGVDQVLALSTGRFRHSWSAAADELVARTTASRASTAGEVVAAGVERISRDEATVLVAARRSVRLGDAEPVVGQVRLIVTLTRVDGAWLASDVGLLD